MTNKVIELLVKDSMTQESVKQAKLALALSQNFKKENPRRIIFTECFFYPQKPSFFENFEIKNKYGRNIPQSNFEIFVKKINSSFVLLKKAGVKLFGQNPNSVFYFVVNPLGNSNSLEDTLLHTNVFFRLFCFLNSIEYESNFKDLASVKEHLFGLLSNSDTALKLIKDHNFGLWLGFENSQYFFFTEKMKKAEEIALNIDFPAKQFGIIRTKGNAPSIFRPLEEQKKQFKKIIGLLKRLSEENAKWEKDFEKRKAVFSFPKGFSFPKH